MDLLELNLTWYIVAFLVTLLVLTIWKTSPRTFPNAVHPKISGWTDLPYFGYLFYLNNVWDTMAVHFLRITREQQWKTWVARAPNIGALGGGMMVMTSEASVKHVLKDNFDNYVKGDEFQAWLSEFLGNGVFASDGVIWKHHRKVASHMFSARLLRHTLAVGYDVGLNMIQRLHRSIDSAKTTADNPDQEALVDVQDLFFRFTIDIFTSVAFGVQLQSFDRNDQHPFAKAFDAIQAAVITRVPNPCWRLGRCLGLSKSEKIIKQSANIINDFAAEVIAQKRRTAASVSENTSLGPDLISRFLEKSQKDETIMTNEELRDIVLNFMIAGRDTTACALTWCIYELTQHQEHGKMILDETIRENILTQNMNSQNEKVAKDRYAALNRMKYTEAFIYEVLRLHPSVPIDIKYAVNKDILPDGTVVPAGTMMCYAPYVLGRNPEVWTKYPVDDFVPKRWLEREKSPSPYAYPQFNAGPRLCLGKGLAMLEIKLGLAMLLNEFEVPKPRWKGADQNVVPPYQMTLTHPTKDGLMVALQRRKK